MGIFENLARSASNPPGADSRRDHNVSDRFWTRGFHFGAFSQPVCRRLVVPLMALSNPRFSSNAELAAAAKNHPPLKRGANGEAVAILQQALLDLGFAMPVSTRARGGLPDGIYGAETEAAVRAFQRQNQLLTDGVAGRITLQQLERSAEHCRWSFYRRGVISAASIGRLTKPAASAPI
jgi:hypothetical protein